jgi:DNA helicase HerA-like ATPase
MDGFDGAKATAQRVGRIVSVAGCQAVCVLERDSRGEVAALQIGGLVKTNIGKSQVYGIVSGVSIPVPSTSETADPEMKIVELLLIGEVSPPTPGRTPAFRRGVSVFPSLGDAVFATTREDLAQVYAPPAAANISIGTLHHDRSVHAHALVDELLGKHFAVLGTTGSGKSCAAAVILRQIIAQNPNSHILLVDPHGEYAQAFGPRAEVVTAETLELPFWMLNFEEILQVLFGPGLDQASPEAEILSDLIVGAKHDYAGGPQQGYEKLYSVDTPVPYRLSDLLTRLNNAMGKLDNTENLPPYRRIKQRILALQYDARFTFMFGGVQVRDRMAPILARLFRIPADGKPICIVDLSGVPSEALPVVVAALCRITHSFAGWSSRACPVLLVCEEAHRFGAQVPEPGFAIIKNWLTRIAKEGRKYGISLGVVSQRPSKLSTDLISQCNTIFAMRLSNNEDLQFLSGASADTAMGLNEFLPTLLTGEAIAMGQGVTMPIRMRFHTLPEGERPGSGAVNVTTAWRQQMDSPNFLQSVVAYWRTQKR